MWQNASSLHNKPIWCGFKMPFMKHVLAFMHIKLVGLPSKNKLAKGIQSATINWHNTHTHTHTQTHTHCTMVKQIPSANPFLCSHRLRPNIMLAQMAMGARVCSCFWKAVISFIFTHINTPKYAIMNPKKKKTHMFYQHAYNIHMHTYIMFKNII